MGTIFLLVLNLLLGLYQTFVFMKTFNWFVSPTFDIPTIGYGLALAFSLTLSLVFGFNQTLAAHHYERTRMKRLDILESGVSVILARIVLVTIIFAISFMLKISIY